MTQPQKTFQVLIDICHNKNSDSTNTDHSDDRSNSNCALVFQMFTDVVTKRTKIAGKIIIDVQGAKHNAAYVERIA